MLANLKTSWSTFLIWGADAILFVVGIFVLHPIYMQICESAQNGDADKCQERDLLYIVFLQLYNGLTNTAVWTAIATIVIAMFTVVLARIGRRQIEDTRILQRAYVSVAPLGINPFISDDGSTFREILGHVNIENVGRLPARDVSVAQPSIVWSECVLRENDLEFETPFPLKIVLPPGSKMPLGTGPHSPDRIGNGGYFYVWGKIEYTDGFGEPRFTKFCHRYPCQPYELAPDGSRRIDAKYARYHEHGNDAD